MILKALAEFGPVRGKGLLVLLAASGALLVSILAPSAQGLPPCLFHTVTGIPCPSCGMTRAFLDLGHGRFLSALNHNLASPLVFIGACALLIASFRQTMTGEEQLTRLWRRVRRVVLPVLLSVLSLAWTLRLWSHFQG